MGRVKDELAKVVVRTLLQKFLKGLFVAVGWQPIVILLVFTILFGSVSGAMGSVYNFLSNSQADIVSDQALKALYDRVSAGTVDGALLAGDPGLAMYQVPWFALAAIDKLQNNCETPQPETYAELLKPTFSMKDSYIKTVTSSITYSGYSGTTPVPHVIEVNTPIKLLDTVETYKGVYKHNYVPSSTTTTTVTYGYQMATVVTVTTTKDIFYSIQEPMPVNYSKFISALQSVGITNKSDQELVFEFGKQFAGHEVDLSQPVDLLMGFEGGIGGLLMGSGAAPPHSWLPWFRAAAERYHGNTPVAQFEALLMAIGFTESSFSESRDMVSSADARGPFQFTDSTWYDYGIKQLGFVIEDVWSAEKAVMATALMVSQAGASSGDLGGIRAALWRYNQSSEYGNLVMGRMFYYGTFTGWSPDGTNIILPGSLSTQGFYWPVPSRNQISSAFGPRINPYTGLAGYHTGIDIPAALMSPIIAPKGGIVRSIDVSNSVYGYKLIIGHDSGVETMYGHMYAIAPGIVEGVRVSPGQVIAYVGNRGNSTGPHLHIEVHYNASPINPLLFFNQPR